MHSDTTPSEAVTAAESRRSAPQQTFPRPVTGVDLLLAGLAVVVGPGVVAVLVIVTGVALDQPWLVSIAIPLATIAAGVSLYMALLRRGWAGRDLGFVRARRRSLWHLLWEVPLLWVTALLLTILIGTLIGIGPAETTSTTSNSADALALGAVGVLATAVCVTILVPALEEILFRRLLFGWLEQRFGIAAALGGSAIVFGVVHVVPPVILLQFLIGLGAALLVRAHRTLWAPLALHGLNNGTVTVVAVTLLQ
ncbi:membrane protease YdiL (CAAX protease family) [Nocardioides salarius]|uniref:Membrane protease YdiL (CAAX protease family) n=1 Tax=Nocardioides salarius TaxID=374513 RepID=A0ABS2MEE9_9ACTN|nr:CPBP family intramembrane glutamic endopeptidase [Nocardioides salarius]MBM7509559.1 membrane protease YdiL (CAAX protease family) [Nocardioides salarius]